MRNDGKSGTMDVVVKIVDILSMIGSIVDNPSCRDIEEGEADGRKEFDVGKYWQGTFIVVCVVFLLKMEDFVDGVINAKLLDDVKKEQSIIIIIVIHRVPVS